jgi:hypothetical protein
MKHTPNISSSGLMWTVDWCATSVLVLNTFARTLIFKIRQLRLEPLRSPVKARRREADSLPARLLQDLDISTELIRQEIMAGREK